MTADQFIKWLVAMRMKGIAKSDAECARLLGISANGLVGIKKNGTDQRTALACRALLEGLEPYS